MRSMTYAEFCAALDATRRTPAVTRTRVAVRRPAPRAPRKG